jgi:hypothetical protein
MNITTAVFGADCASHPPCDAAAAAGVTNAPGRLTATAAFTASASAEHVITLRGAMHLAAATPRRSGVAWSCRRLSCPGLEATAAAIMRAGAARRCVAAPAYTASLGAPTDAVITCIVRGSLRFLMPCSSVQPSTSRPVAAGGRSALHAPPRFRSSILRTPRRRQTALPKRAPAFLRVQVYVALGLRRCSADSRTPRRIVHEPRVMRNLAC